MRHDTLGWPLLVDAEDEILAYLQFPEPHRRQLHSTNPLEHLHKEIKRRTHVVGIFPNPPAVVRLHRTGLGKTLH